MNARRNSSKGSLPKALQLSDHASHLQATLSTPPPTGFKHSPMGHRAPKSALFAGFTGFGEAPITPMTPDMFKQQDTQQQGQHDPLAVEDEQVIRPESQRPMSDEEAVEASAINSAPSTPPPMSPCETMSSSARSAKRSFDATADMTPPESVVVSDRVNASTAADAGLRLKRQMHAPSPDTVLAPARACLAELQEMPMAYLQHHFLSVTRQTLNQKRGAACYIKAVPVSQRGRTGRIRARVSSQDRPGVVRELQFDLAPRSLDGDDEEATSDAESTASESQGAPRIDRREANSSIFPLHVEVALLRAPLLGRLLLSGLVGKGDLLDLEFPYPHLFGQVVRWMYTGQLPELRDGDEAAEHRDQVHECIAYLWGRY
ncbi:hypothetical protein BCR37DRAFT_392866 [Protomyces lactucae-debilis]|uniref:BTB domain-containing protein n=1 Tax=Protomyces lactucae-debilis TaxID=2754530 RepID=A0A1Y2FHC7_PROLT|nr:uncharacterized protein BCR37DRAFT_392866 [Protomyces lactucae-debilis]ORY82666.1 hypothetical protein BCR37DRAFT_392866 [Protomyces lactucae-debilis]